MLVVIGQIALSMLFSLTLRCTGLRMPHQLRGRFGLPFGEGGRFAAEFAGSGNVAVLTTAIREELEARGYTWEGRSPWYFPTIGEYTSLLERTGFRVIFAQHFDKPTPLNGNTSIRKWLDMVSNHFFSMFLRQIRSPFTARLKIR